MWLLDGNVLVALIIDTHEFHHRVERWFDSQSDPFATCAITEGTLLRVHTRGSDRVQWTATQRSRNPPDLSEADDKNKCGQSGRCLPGLAMNRLGALSGLAW